METNAKRLWQRTLNELSSVLTEVTVLQFFDGSHGISLEGNVLNVGLPEGKDGNLLRQQFGFFIDNALIQAGASEDLKMVFSQTSKRILFPSSEISHSSSESHGTEHNLQHRFTFDTFVMGPSNQFPVTMAKYVAQHPGDDANRTNPLFMYGPTGVGKTHLLHAIGNMARELNPNLTLLYTTSENLMNEYVRSWTRDDLKETFRTKFRTPDILLVDDIQYMAGKKGLQDEFFNIFNTLKDGQRQIVMTSDRAPAEIPDLVDRLISRFQSGLCADVDMPAYETRLNILRLKMQTYSDVKLSKEVLDFIAQKVSSSVRALEGALSCTVNYARMFPENAETAVTVEVLEKSILKNFIQQEESIVRLTCADIQKVVCAHYGVRMEDLLGQGRVREIAIPRQVAIFLCRKLTSSSTTDIGREFNRNHSTILYSCSTVQDLYKQGDAPISVALKTLVGALGRTLSELS